MTRPAEEPGAPLRQMVTLDRIRLTGLLRKSPALRGFSMKRSVASAQRNESATSSRRSIASCIPASIPESMIASRDTLFAA